jgi:hypothetical protein
VDDLWKNIGQYGFPIVVSCYLLFRLERTMRELRDAVRELLIRMK